MPVISGSPSPIIVPVATTPTATPVSAPAASTTPAATGLDAATTANPAPVATPIAAATSAGVSALAARLGGVLSSPSPALLELVPGRVPDAVSITTVLKSLSSSPQAGIAVDTLVAAMKQGTGIDVPPALVSAAKANPERIVDMAVLTPQQMRAGFDALHAQHKARGAAPATKATALPQTTNTAKLDGVDVKRPVGDFAELTPGLWRGDVPNAKLSDVAAKKNTVLAEIVDRLASNAGKAKGDQFVVEHAGSRFTSLPHFLKALEKDGYTLTAKVTHRVADFFALKTKAADGSILDVPMAAMVKTGIKTVDLNGAAGKEAVVPTVHSEIVFSLRAGPTSSPPQLDGDIKWYQGLSGTGFFPCDLMRASPWTGSTTAATLDATTSWKAANLCGVLADVVQDVSTAAGLAMSGYGVTGVCNDSVAIVQQAVTGTTTAYPLFMRDAVLLPAIDQRLKDTNRTDDGALKILRAAIETVPSDDVPLSKTTIDSVKARALASVPWAAGAAPFASVDDARAILGS